MKFYIINKLANKLSIDSSGVDIEKMGEAFKLVEKNFNKKHLDEIMDYCFVFLQNNLDFSSDEKVESAKNKKINFALVKEKQIFKIKDSNNSKITYEYFAVVHEGKLKTFANKELAEKETLNQSLVSSNETEKKVLNWLENGRVGLSSATMCAHLFPNLINHHRFKDMKDYEGNIEVNWPHDTGDFNRCLKFFEYVPEAKNRIDELRCISKEWNSLIDNWNMIESFIKKEDSDSAYELIKKSISKKLKYS